MCMFETETSVYEVKIEIGKLPKQSGIKVLNTPTIVVRKVAVRAGETSPVQAGQTFVGDQLKIEQGRMVLYNGKEQVLRTSVIVSRQPQF